MRRRSRRTPNPVVHKPAVPPAERVAGASRAELELAELLGKLYRWLAVQPEWVYLLSTNDRNTRKRVERAVSKALTRFPPNEREDG